MISSTVDQIEIYTRNDYSAVEQWNRSVHFVNLFYPEVSSVIWLRFHFPAKNMDMDCQVSDRMRLEMSLHHNISLSSIEGRCRYLYTIHTCSHVHSFHRYTHSIEFTCWFPFSDSDMRQISNIIAIYLYNVSLVEN